MVVSVLSSPAGAVTTEATTPPTAATAQSTFIHVSRSPRNTTAMGSATTGVSAPMMSATAMLTYCSVMKKAQMFTPNSTPIAAQRRMSSQVGHRPMTTTMPDITMVAIHIRQKPRTTPSTSVALPSTPPNDQNRVATSTAAMPVERSERGAARRRPVAAIAVIGTSLSDVNRPPRGHLQSAAH